MPEIDVHMQKLSGMALGISFMLVKVLLLQMLLAEFSSSSSSSSFYFWFMYCNFMIFSLVQLAVMECRKSSTFN
jgi:hypothetical protein